MKTKFRIRPSRDCSNYTSKMKAYHDYLSKIESRVDDTLLKFFKSDFFHDGSISNQSFDIPNSCFSMNITCPNFTRPMDGSYFNVDFKVKFFDIKEIFVEFSPEDQIGKYVNNTFLYSEIGSLIKEYKDDEIGEQSLIMELLGEHENYYISIIFSYIEVEPVEPLAFEVLLETNSIVYPS